MMKVFSVHLPTPTIKAFKHYVSEKKERRPMDGITIQGEVYKAIVDYLKKHKES